MDHTTHVPGTVHADVRANIVGCDGGSDAGTVTGPAGSAGSVGSVMDQRERMVWMDGAPMRRLLVEGSDGRWYVSLSAQLCLFYLVSLCLFYLVAEIVLDYI